jgi:hypothetical protein
MRIGRLREDHRPETPPYFVPAQPGWLALFEDELEGQLVVRAEPVLAWRFPGPAAGDPEPALGQAVVGARPWLEKADVEQAAHLFEIVHEAQLDADFLAELRNRSHHSRAQILDAARRSQDNRKRGHGSWLREHRYQPPESSIPSQHPLRVF